MVPQSRDDLLAAAKCTLSSLLDIRIQGDKRDGAFSTLNVQSRGKGAPWLMRHTPETDGYLTFRGLMAVPDSTTVDAWSICDDRTSVHNLSEVGTNAAFNIKGKRQSCSGAGT